MEEQARPKRRPGPIKTLRALAQILRREVQEVRFVRRWWQDTPRAVPGHLVWKGLRVQLPGDGVGLLFHRRYQADIEAPRLSAKRLMASIQRDLSAFAPRELAEFTKTKGRSRRMRVGDEYTITILGPWNGDVCVVDVEPTSFSLVTLRGHPEAGQIRFEVLPHPERRNALRFQILSWARSRDMLVSLSYHEGKIGKVLQKGAWVTFCERVVEQSGGRLLGQISVVTEEQEFAEEVVPVE